MEVLTLEHKEVKKILKRIKHNRTHKKALKLNGAFYCMLDGVKYRIEDVKILRKIYKCLYQ